MPQKEQEVKLLETEKYKVQFCRDHMLDYPEMWMEVFISDRHVEPEFAEMFGRARCKQAVSPIKADLVVFTGGPDVNPELYKTKCHQKTSFSRARDDQDIELFKLCIGEGIPMLGICRGAQFLHVMNGGTLYQHVDGHCGKHSMITVKDKQTLHSVSSTHHQMVRPNNRMEVLAYAEISRERWLDPKQKDTGPHRDIEAYWYDDTCCLGIQGHPEYKGYPAFTKWALEQVQDYIVFNSDVAAVNGNYRLKKRIILGEPPNKNKK